MGTSPRQRAVLRTWQMLSAVSRRVTQIPSDDTYELPARHGSKVVNGSPRLVVPRFQHGKLTEGCKDRLTFNRDLARGSFVP